MKKCTLYFLASVIVSSSCGSLLSTDDRDWELEYEAIRCAVRIEDEDPDFDKTKNHGNYLFIDFFKNVTCTYTDYSGFKPKETKTDINDYFGCSHRFISDEEGGNISNKYDASADTCRMYIGSDEYTVNYSEDSELATFTGPDYEKSVICRNRTSSHPRSHPISRFLVRLSL